MYLYLVAVGTKMPSWINEGFKEYAKRFPASCTLELIEIPAEKRSKQSDISRLIQAEGEKILSVIKPNHYIIALDVKGKAWDTMQLTDNLNTWRQEGKNIYFLIGGPDGLSGACLQKADRLWSLSSLTLPHPLVRVILTEQLYRALTIIQRHPYHRH